MGCWVAFNMKDKTADLYLRASIKQKNTPEGSLISQGQRLIERFGYYNSL